VRRDNDLHALFQTGQLHPGAVVVHKTRRRGDPTISAVLERDGVHVEGRVYSSLSTAARVMAGHAVNGWTYWQLAESGKRLAELRERST
jgi:RAMA domain-containing protein